MRIRHIRTEAALQTLRAHWNRLADDRPFCRFEWLTAWWRHYQPEGQLLVLQVVTPAGETVGIAPWYLSTPAGKPRRIRFLASGDACTDYLTVLAKYDHREDVSQALARWLADPENSGQASSGAPLRWNELVLDGVATTDRQLDDLSETMGMMGCATHTRLRESTWGIALPNEWKDYEAKISKSFRKQLRRLRRRHIDTGRAQLRISHDRPSFQIGLEILIELHQRRWNQRGLPGCFGDERFLEFFCDAGQKLHAAGLAEIDWLEYDGRPVAADFNLLSQHCVYAYQSGIEPATLNVEPGRLLTLLQLDRFIELGYSRYDLLRGDEAYKAHWRATPRPLREIRISHPRASDRLRQQLWRYGAGLKQLVRESLIVGS